VEIVDNRGLLVRVRDQERITKSVKQSRYIGKDDDGADKVLVNWTLNNTRKLANLGLRKTPSPILRDYDWPGIYKPYDHQRQTASFLTANSRAFCFSEQGCVDSETEYLSPTGWKKISEYDGGQVAQYLPDTGEAEFVEPEEYVKLPCANMVRLKTKYGIDQLLSPEHRVLAVASRGKHKQEVLHASEVLQRHDNHHAGKFSRPHAPKLGTDSIAFSSMGIPCTFKAPDGEGLGLSPAELRLQVAVIADGHFESQTTRCVVRLKKQRKIERLRTLLDNADVDYTETVPEYPSAPGFHVFKFYAPMRAKVFDERFWRADQTQLQAIVDEVLHWDACTTRGARFSTYVKESADFVQYAMAGTGRTARLLTRGRSRRGRTDWEVEYTVQIRDTPVLSLRSSQSSVWEEPSTDGFKYCFRVPSTFLIFRRNGCVFASGNTGKTGAVIWAADYLMSIGDVKRVLIVSPLSIMHSAWITDIFKIAMHRTAAVAHGTQKTRKKVINGDYEFVVINYDGVPIMEKELQGKFDLIVADEANFLKTATTRRWKAFNRVLQPENRLWMLTGTPAAQSPVDAYGLAKLAVPQRVPPYFTAWKNRVMIRVTQFKWIPAPDATKMVRAALQPAIRYTKADCLDLPPVTYVTREIDLTAQQKKYYKQLKKQMMIEAAGESISAVHAAAGLNKLLQISSGAVYSDEGEVIQFDAKNRLDEVSEVVQEAANKVIVFVPFKHAIDIVADRLRKDGFSTEIVNGSVSMKARTKIFKDFQESEDPQVLVIQPQSASHGVTLTAADTIVWFGPVASVETWLQANERINRPSQENKMTVIKIYGSEVEKKVYDALESKEANQKTLVALYENEIKS